MQINLTKIKPSCIAEVTIPVSSIPTIIANCKSPIISFPANQSEVTENCENTITDSNCFGICISLFLNHLGIDQILLITYEVIQNRLK